MNESLKRFAFYNIFFLCTFIGLFMVLGINSFARPSLMLEMQEKWWSGDGYNYLSQYHIISVSDYNNPVSYNYCFYHVYEGDTRKNYLVCDARYNPTVNVETISFDGDRGTMSQPSANTVSTPYGNVKVYPTSNYVAMNNDKNYDAVVTDGYAFDNLNDAANYVLNGVSPQLPFDETLKLDSFKITSLQIKASQLTFHSKLEVKWSDPRIANVQVKIVGTANSPATFEGNSSPFKQKFYASNYVMKNGDVIHFTATPYKSNGEYGESLYYSLIYDDGLPTNWYRKLVNTPYNDNTLDIPYYDVSAQPQTINVPIDGTTQNICYKVNYNPTTNEITNENVYNVYYSPVVIIPEGTSEENESEIINYITNEYNTNNYYNIVNNISYNDISYGDVSEGDIKESYKETKDYFKLFKKFVKLLANIVGFIFPFLSGGVVLAITVGVGFITTLIIVMFAVKLIGKILDWIF